DRQEIPIGKASLDMKTIIPVYFGLSAMMSLIMLGARLSVANLQPMSLWPYLAICLFATVFLMYNFLLSEMANLLVNPTEGLALAHQPVGGLTYVAAKLTHFAGFIVIGVLSLNLFPAVAPLFVA